MYPHIRLVAEEWLCNSDSQIITDARAAQDYKAKYACKGIIIKNINIYRKYLTSLPGVINF
jgi:hypothetical protein